MPVDERIERSPVELRSESVSEILGRMPHWTIRYGITVIFGLILLLILLSWFIRYPDAIVAPGTLTTTDPPRAIIARTEGKLVQLNAEDGDTVKAGTTIAVVESPTSPASIQQLQSVLSEFDAALIDPNGTIPLMNDLRLGSGQADYDALRGTATELRTWRAENYRQERNAQMRKKINGYGRLIQAAQEQLAIGNRKQLNYVKEAGTDSIFERKGVISTTAYRTKQNEFMDHQMALKDLAASVEQNKIIRLDLESQLNEFLHSDAAKERELTELARARVASLRTFADTWQLNYALTAPVDGILHYNGRVVAEQTVKPQELLFNVAPVAQAFVFEAVVPSIGAGKVKTGQQAYVSLDNYPREEFGRLIGTVRSMAVMPNAEGYRAVIELPNELLSSFHRPLAYRPEMKGQVEIVARHRSILGRIFDKLRGAVSE